MRQLLIVSPHYPPTDAVDMHRIRTSSHYYEQYGWKPTVLAVRPELAGRLVDQRLLAAAPNNVRVKRTGALPENLAKSIGFSAIGFRAYGALRAAGDELIHELKPDLAFFSTTAFPLMALGASWKRRFGLPFVLDMQDPWYSAPAGAMAFRQRDAKARIMFGIHRLLEARTMARVDGIIAVSDEYVPALEAAYPRLVDIPRDTIPFGFERQDFEVARRTGCSVDFGFDRSSTKLCVYAGRIGDDMVTALRALLTVLSAPALTSLRLGFLGTGYQLERNTERVSPLARQFGLEASVCERPNRVSLLDSLSTLSEADVILIFGSDDRAYQPSKLYQYLSSDRPILCVALTDTPLVRQISDMESVFVLAINRPLPEQVGALAAWIDRISSTAVLDSRRRIMADAYSARATAERECAVFDAAVSV